MQPSVQALINLKNASLVIISADSKINSSFRNDCTGFICSVFLMDQSNEVFRRKSN